LSLADVEVDELRCFQRAELNLHEHLNVIHGANGAGKTSLLEAIYLLGRGRSFRTRHTERLIRREATRLQVLGRLEQAPVAVIGVACSQTEGLEARIDRRPASSLASLSVALPVQVLDPGIHRLVEEGPSYRRKWLDWGVFHVEQSFVDNWLAYTRALKQRNAALQSGAPVAPWDVELARLGEEITEARERTLERLKPLWSATIKALLEVDVSLGFFRGWGADLELRTALAAHEQRDRERGSTQYGPHRFDVLLRCGSRLARDVLSRGQQKLLGSCLALSMSKLVSQGDRHPPLLLLDDPAAELDADHAKALVGEIRSLKGQLVVTALRDADSAFGAPDRVFHVEQGRVKQL
jgi:DNA replication and repair protein RecF